MHTNTAKDIARWVALGALFLIPFTPLIVASSYFFPFITGKAFFFRILVEIAFSAWVVLALLDKDYRPRFSWVGMAVIAFVAWMFVADLFAIYAVKAFWSNFERMEGWMLLAHLCALFFTMSAVLRVEKKWRAWFLASLGVSLIIMWYAFLQLTGASAIHQGSTRVDASLGNSAYLAIYLLFNTGIAAWLALTEKQAWLKWSLIALAVLEAVLIFFTETRGTVLGLVIALALAALLTALTAGKRVRHLAAGAFALILIGAGSFYMARDSSFIQDNSVLKRIASISLADGSTRFTIWHMAYEGVLERPFTGWGQEGFNYIFNKYYDPSLYQQEPWFDRAHNAFIDWLTAGGFPAFLLYLSLFGTAVALLWRSSALSRPERIVFTAVLAGYAIHNLFVFDNLYSYVYFFALLALIDSQVARPFVALETAETLDAEDGALYVLPCATIMACALIWTINVPGMRVATRLITALSPASSSASANIAAFTDLVSHSAYMTQEVREQIVGFAASAVRSDSLSNEDKQKIVVLAITEMQKQVAAYPLDARERLQLAYAYRLAGDTANSLKEIVAASDLSPQKESILIQKGALLWDQNDAIGAQKVFTQAYALGPQFKELAVYAAAGNIAIGKRAVADEILLGAYGTTTVDSDILAIAHYRVKDFTGLINIWKLRASAPGADAQKWFGLAAAYYAAGDSASAIRTINTATRLFPDSAQSGAATIAEILKKSQ